MVRQSPLGYPLRPLQDLLLAGGSLDLGSAYRGGLDPTGYALVGGKGGQARFAGTATDAGKSRRPGFGLRGVNYYVYAMAADGAGNLYVGGDFSIVGDVAASNVAKWDGTRWSPSGAGTNGYFRALAVDSAGNLFAGGEFTDAGGGFSFAGGRVSYRFGLWALPPNDCTGDVVTIPSGAFQNGEIFFCQASSSITTDPGVDVENGADVTFMAPLISLGTDFRVEVGGVFRGIAASSGGD